MEEIWSQRSENVEDAGREKDVVGGKPSPGKLLSRILTFGAILRMNRAM